MEPGTINYLGAIGSNNGVRGKVNNSEHVFTKKCITVNYNGSVGEAFYQSEPFWASDDVNCLFSKGWELNKYVALFFCTILKQEKYKFSYGRKWKSELMEKTEIELPVNDLGKPDFDFMEDYIKNIPYGDRI